MPIVITIEHDHPEYRRLLACLESPDAERGGLVMIEQHTAGTWSLHLARVTPTPNLSRCSRSLVRIHEEKH